MGEWVAIGVDLPPEGRVVAFERGGRSLLLCHADGQPYVIANECPHAAVPLAPGVLRGCVLECPFHGGKLDVRTGAPVTPPIRRPVDCFPVRRAGDGLEVELPPSAGGGAAGPAPEKGGIGE